VRSRRLAGASAETTHGGSRSESRNAAPALRASKRRYSSVTLLARLRGWSTSVPFSKMQTPAEQIPRGAHLGPIDIGLRKVPAAEQRGNLEGVGLVVLGLAAVDGLRVEGVAEDELDPFPPAQIGEPGPGEDALDGDDAIVAEQDHR